MWAWRQLMFSAIERAAWYYIIFTNAVRSRWNDESKHGYNGKRARSSYSTCQLIVNNLSALWVSADHEQRKINASIDKVTDFYNCDEVGPAPCIRLACSIMQNYAAFLPLAGTRDIQMSRNVIPSFWAGAHHGIPAETNTLPIRISGIWPIDR